MGTKREISFETGVKGRCITKRYSGGIKITVTGGENDGTIYDIKKDNITIPVISGENLFFQLNSDNTFLYKLYPFGEWKDMDTNYPSLFTVRTLEFPKKKDMSISEPWIRQGRVTPWGKWQPECLMFSALLEVLDPADYRELIIPTSFQYCFDRDTLGNMKLKGVGRDAAMTDSYLNLSGYDWIEDEIPYSNNILPDLENLILDRNRPFVVKMRNGYVNKLQRVREGYGS